MTSQTSFSHDGVGAGGVGLCIMLLQPNSGNRERRNKERKKNETPRRATKSMKRKVRGRNGKGEETEEARSYSGVGVAGD